MRRNELKRTPDEKGLDPALEARAREFEQRLKRLHDFYQRGGCDLVQPVEVLPQAAADRTPVGASRSLSFGLRRLLWQLTRWSLSSIILENDASDSKGLTTDLDDTSLDNVEVDLVKAVEREPNSYPEENQ